MKKYILTITLVFATLLAYTQTVTLDNLEFFDKITVKGGDVLETDIAPLAPRNKVELNGISEEKFDYSISAGNLTIDLKGQDIERIIVFNKYIKRLVLENDTRITGAKYLGNNGNYLITDINGPLHTASNFNFPNVDIRIPHIEIPNIDIDIPEIEFDEDFDFDFDHDFDFDFRNHMEKDDWDMQKEEIKRSAKEIKEEVRRVIKEVKEQIERQREE